MSISEVYVFPCSFTPGNTQILAWAKKLPGAYGLVNVTMEASIGTQLPSIVRSHSIDVGVLYPKGPDDPPGKFVKVTNVGKNSIKLKFGDDTPPLQWKILWSTFPHPPTCESAGNNWIFDNTLIGSRTGEYTISGLSNNKRYYFDVCSKSSGPVRKFIAQDNAKTLN